MIDWLLRSTFQLTTRLVATLAGCWTLQQVILREGYRCELSTLLIGAVVTIVVLRLWMPWTKE